MRSEKGQTLIEVLVGLASSVIVIGAITIATLSALNNAQFSENQNLATQYAQQAMESIRNMRDTNYQNFSVLSGSYCMGKSCTSINSSNLNTNPNSTYCWTAPASGCGQNVGIFVRQTSFEQNSSYCDGNTKVTVTASWNDAKCTTSSDTFCHKVNLTSCLSNVNIVPTL